MGTKNEMFINYSNGNSRLSIKISVVFVIVFTFIFVSSGNAQWKKTNGPYGGTGLTNIVSDGASLLGMTEDSVYVSNDNGMNWNEADSGLPRNSQGLVTMFGLASNKGSVYAGTYAGIFRSTNRGSTWKSISSDFGPYTQINSFGFIDTIIFAGIQTSISAGIYRSTDNGKSWACVDSFFYNCRVNCFLTINDTVFAAVLGKGLLRSKDYGENWELLDSAGVSINYITSIILKNKRIYVSTLSGLYCSDNNGDDWQKLSDYSTQSLTTLGDYLISGDGYGAGVQLSRDDGSSWESMNSGFKDSYFSSVPWITNIINFGGTLFASADNGLFISSDTAKTWTMANFRRNETDVYSIVEDNKGTIYAGTNNGFFISKDNGNNWLASNLGLHNSSVYCIIIHDSSLFIGTGNGVYRSTNGDSSWLSANNGISDKNSIKSIVAHGTDLFAAGMGAVYRSTDGGENWSAINSGLTAYNISSMVVDNDIITIGAKNGIFQSSDYGLHWQDASSGLTDKNITALLLFNDRLYAGTYLHGVFSSPISGGSWLSVPFFSLASQAIHSLSVYDNKLFIAGTDYGTLIYSLKDSNLVIGYKSGLPSPISIYSIGTQDSTLFAGTYGNGIWSRPVSEVITGVDNVNNQQPSSFYLFQNYPNPFNPTTAIQYIIAKTSFVSIKVYDILGRIVIKLVNEIKLPGKYTVQFNGSHLTSGVYFYSISAGSFHKVRKMILIK